MAVHESIRIKSRSNECCFHLNQLILSPQYQTTWGMWQFFGQLRPHEFPQSKGSTTAGKVFGLCRRNRYVQLLMFWFTCSLNPQILYTINNEIWYICLRSSLGNRLFASSGCAPSREVWQLHHGSATWNVLRNWICAKWVTSVLMEGLSQHSSVLGSCVTWRP